MADAAGLNFDPDLPRFGLGTLALDQLERSVRFWDLNRFHFCHFNTPWRSAATLLAWPDLARTRQQFSVPLLTAVNSSIGFNLSVRGSRGCGLVSTAERQCHTGSNRTFFRPLQVLYQLAGGRALKVTRKAGISGM